VQQRPTSSNSSRIHNGAAVMRHQVFVLGDGSVVVQWTEARVQDLLTGDIKPYHFHEFGHPVTDYELERLKAAGAVESYNRSYVWLYSQPEKGRFEEVRTQEQTLHRVRTYYLNTTLLESQRDVIERFLAKHGLTDTFSVSVKDGLLAIFGKDGAPFRQIKDAEAAHRHLLSKDQKLFEAAAVAFIETTRPVTRYSKEETLDLNAIIASQTGTETTVGKQVVLACATQEDATRIAAMLLTLELKVRVAQTAKEVLTLLEESDSLSTDLLIMEMTLPDMHGWEMLSKIRELHNLSKLSVIALVDDDTPDGDQALMLTVAAVDAVLVKPISLMRLRHTIWQALNKQSE
jgi:CheY-like chemotaxis protein